MKYPVLVLNADYLPHRVIDWKDAFVSIYSKGSETAYIASTYEDVVRDSAGRTYNIPAVIVLKEYVDSNNKKSSYSKSAIYTRDKNICQYCGGKFPRDRLSIDHVIPRCKSHLLPAGVKISSFENCVTSCLSCNSKKADKTLKESGLTLLKPPRPITKGQKMFITLKSKKTPKEWSPYLESMPYV
jgi:5-methylcytosine-specific restriction endonuclease McrA